MNDEDMDIPTAMEHPGLVVTGASYDGGPVRIAPGSSSRHVDPGMPVLFVGVADLDAAGDLDRETRFFLLDAKRRPQRILKGRIGRLGAAKMEELLRLRKLGL